MSLYAISLATGLKVEKVRNAIGGMMGAGGAGGIVRTRGANGVTYYETFKPTTPKPEAQSRRVAERITIGRGSLWGAGW